MRYQRGEIERKNTFEQRILTEEPLFVRKRKEAAAMINTAQINNKKAVETDMVLTNETLNHYLDTNRLSITDKQRKEIIDALGKEPDNVHNWSEQDLYEQLRKLLR